MKDLTPKEIVKELDKYIIGQLDAKKSVAIALRNRFRRQQLKSELKDEILPKNILMIGPTGVGKTEIARRLARLNNSPFVKVEATKFTEVGYVGRDVESMVRDLVEISIRLIKNEKVSFVEEKAKIIAEDILLNLLMYNSNPKKETSSGNNPFDILFGNRYNNTDWASNEDIQENEDLEKQKKNLKHKLQLGELEDIIVEVEIEDNGSPMVEMFSNSGIEEMGLNLQEMFGGMLPKKNKKRKLPVREARKTLTQQEAQKLIDMNEVITLAIDKAEQSGIIFIDEIDKIAGKTHSNGPDVSRGGVQRDILPIVEGSTVITKYGPIKTDHILFIAAGAFHVSKPSDLIPELQGRFPIRVELKNLTKEDFYNILVEPRNSMIKQYTELLKTEDILIEFTENALDEIAEIAYTVNDQTENIGARRLHTIMEKLLEDISFDAPELLEKNVVINRDYVKNKLQPILKNEDLTRYIL